MWMGELCEACKWNRERFILLSCICINLQKFCDRVMVAGCLRGKIIDIEIVNVY